MKRLVYPGSFDPVTNGHYDLIERASRMTDELIVAVLNNHNKRQFFSVQERKDMLRQVTAGLDNVIIDSSEDLLVDYVRSVKAGFILRGLRAVSDFEYELQYAMLNQRLDKNVEAVYLMTSSDNSFLSSSMVSEIGRLCGDISSMVPPVIHDYVKQRLLKK